MSGQEVARLRLPVPARGMNRLVDYLEAAYGKGLTMSQDDDWLVIRRPDAGLADPSAVTLHIADTGRLASGEFFWRCRCGATEGGFTDQAFARKGGDEHLAAANVP